MYTLEGGGDESKKTWFAKISNHSLDHINTYRKLFLDQEDVRGYLQKYIFNAYSRWYSTSKSIKLMQENNPVIIPRNHIVENVLSSADEGDLKPLNKFLKILENPYDNNLKISNYYKTDIKSGEPYMTFCGT